LPREIAYELVYHADGPQGPSYELDTELSYVKSFYFAIACRFNHSSRV